MGFPRKTHAMPSSDEKSNILFNLTWTKGLELNFNFSLVTDFFRRLAPLRATRILYAVHVRLIRMLNLFLLEWNMVIPLIVVYLC